ncbi:hypothetical protein BDZ91DRAFT_217847 [Kalaharituber pfeilii]|nr:hypothetical protein BDZ91DRAFT_217847 [Kalaharituber pfeilii]
MVNWSNLPSAVTSFPVNDRQLFLNFCEKLKLSYQVGNLLIGTFPVFFFLPFCRSMFQICSRKCFRKGRKKKSLAWRDTLDNG